MRRILKVLALALVSFMLFLSIASAAPPLKEEEQVRKQKETQQRVKQENRETKKETYKREFKQEQREVKKVERQMTKKSEREVRQDNGNRAIKRGPEVTRKTKVVKNSEVRTERRVDRNHEEVRYHGERPKTEYNHKAVKKDHAEYRKNVHKHITVRHDYNRPGNYRPWYRQSEEWRWFASHHHSNLRVYTDSRSEAIVRVRFVSYNHPHYLQDLHAHYGKYCYKKRYCHHGQYGWGYFWLGRETVIAVFINDDGRARTVIWYRPALERYLVDSGYIGYDALAVYSGYYGDVPAYIAKGYAADVLWVLDEDGEDDED